MSEGELYAQCVERLFSDIRDEDEYWKAKPLLAHYTTIQTLEQILKSGEIWMSNPLFMNDYDEVRFGYREGREAFDNCSELQEVCGSKGRWERLKECFDGYWETFDRNHVIDTFIFCLSEHHIDDFDGLLSMWRGYGGDGYGAAIVFDTAKITPNRDYPIVLAKVKYMTTEERQRWLRLKCVDLASFLKTSNVPDDLLHLPAHALYQRMMLAALYSKHPGFREEQEWRITYLRERDQVGSFNEMISYIVNHKRVEPKLKLNVELMPANPHKLSSLVNRIILGPAVRSELSMVTVQRMLDHLGLGELKSRIFGSFIPYRQT